MFFKKKQTIKDYDRQNLKLKHCPSCFDHQDEIVLFLAIILQEFPLF